MGLFRPLEEFTYFFIFFFGKRVRSLAFLGFIEKFNGCCTWDHYTFLAHPIALPCSCIVSPWSLMMRSSWGPFLLQSSILSSKESLCRHMFSVVTDRQNRSPNPLKQVPNVERKMGKLRLKLNRQHSKALEKYYMDASAVENVLNRISSSGHLNCAWEAQESMAWSQTRERDAASAFTMVTTSSWLAALDKLKARCERDRVSLCAKCRKRWTPETHEIFRHEFEVAVKVLVIPSQSALVFLTLLLSFLVFWCRFWMKKESLVILMVSS